VAVASVLASWIPLFRQLEAREEHQYAELRSFLVQSEPAEVLPIGHIIDRYLQTEILRDPEGELAVWARSLTPPRERNLIVVCKGRPIETQAEQHALGALQVVVYTDDDPFERLRQLRADLLKTLEGFPIEGDLLDHYGALMTLAESLRDQDDLLRFTVYYYECFLRSKRLRDVPDRLLSVRTTMSNHKLIRSLMRDTTPSSQAAR
jgi:hypothetical protein